MHVADLHIDRGRLAECARRFHVVRLEIFGSFARGDAGTDSDLDLLVTFGRRSKVGLDVVQLQQELEALSGRSVDLLTRESVLRSPNKYFRRYALAHTEPLYERT